LPGFNGPGKHFQGEMTMIVKYKSLMATIFVLGLAGAGPASAAPASGLKSTHVTAETHADVVQVQHRRHLRGHRHHGHGHHHHHRHHRHGWGTGAAIVGGVVAGALIADAARGASYSAIERCEARFRSFDRSTGTYTTYGGETRVCPYLR
jgi:hypothetical protein